MTNMQGIAVRSAASIAAAGLFEATKELS